MREKKWRTPWAGHQKHREENVRLHGLGIRNREENGGPHGLGIRNIRGKKMEDPMGWASETEKKM